MVDAQSAHFALCPGVFVGAPLNVSTCRCASCFLLQVGRWLGYTTATLLALYSLFNIVKTFKRVLLFKVYMEKPPVE